MIEITESGRITAREVTGDNVSLDDDKNIKVNLRENSTRESCILHLSDTSVFNELTISSEEGFADTEFTLFYSLNGTHWIRIPVLSELKTGKEVKKGFALIEAKAFQVIFHNNGYTFNSEKHLTLKLAKQIEITINASSNEDRLWVADNLVDKRDDYGWASHVSESPSEEWIEFDCSRSYYIDAFALKSTLDRPECFPAEFEVLVSEDNSNWNRVVSETGFIVTGLQTFLWTFSAVKARYIRIYIPRTGSAGSKKFQSVILESEIYAMPENRVGESKSALTAASEMIKGAVQFTENGEASPGKAVQGNDRRIRTATTEYPGITRLARDNQKDEGVVVQGNDSRLRESTEFYPGIVQLAKNGENRAQVAVQGNDERLQPGSTSSAGIVEFAEDGESRDSVAVQGSDSRLKEGTTESHGILRFAENGESTPNRAVMADDKRLRVAAISWPGIVQLAEHGEILQGRAVQADDPRLKEGGVNIKGRVQFAEHNEVSALKSLQSDDPRIKRAEVDKPGIVQFAAHEKVAPMLAVQADDPRLSDARTPLPHDHDYAEKNHSFNSHSGTLNLTHNIETEKVSTFVTKSPGDVPVSTENVDGHSFYSSGGSVFRSGVHPAVTAIGSSQSAITAYSNEKPAARLASAHDFALVLSDKFENGENASGRSLLAKGNARFESTLQLSREQTVTIAVKHFSNEVFTEGELLTVNENGQFAKMNAADQVCAGVVGSSVNAGGLILGETGEKFLPVIIYGIARLKVKGVVNAGRQIGFAGNVPGLGSQVAKSQPFYAVSLHDHASEGEKLVNVLLQRG